MTMRHVGRMDKHHHVHPGGLLFLFAIMIFYHNRHKKTQVQKEKSCKLLFTEAPQNHKK